MSEVVDISSGSLDSSLWFIQLSTSYDVLCTEVDIIQPFPILNQWVPCLVVTVISWPAYRFLRKHVKMVWYSHLLKNFPQFVVIHTIRGFSMVIEAKVDIFLGLPCFLHDPANVGNLISSSSASSKPSFTWEDLKQIEEHFILFFSQ